MNFDIALIDFFKILAVVVLLIAIFVPKKSGYKYNSLDKKGVIFNISYGVLIRQLDGMKYSSKEIIDNVYRYEFTNGDDNVSVLYSRSGTANYIYETETAVKVTDIMGRQQLINPANGVVTIPLDGNVKYIKAVMGEIKETV